MVHSVALQDGIVISDERARIDMAFVHHRLADTYWMAGRTSAQTARSWAHCLCFGIYAPTGMIIGFGRVLTDFALRAHLGDVVIDGPWRGRGLGSALVATILAHPELETVRHWTLNTKDAHGLYARVGFRVDTADPQWMTLDRSHASDRAQAT